ncbi:MAG TPA: hypothetical protein PK566_03825 [Pseudobacteroides sp.]|nr:hypothetical protein [Pseudobacteroides sp.]
MSINFHLPDIVENFNINILLYELLKTRPECFWPDIKIASVYGTFPTSMWNGGRTYGGVTSERRFIVEILNQYNIRGIPCRYTFSNPHIKEEHLDDSFCNMCLRLGHNGLNEVIVVSPVLEEYIRKNYPKYKIISSTCKQIEDIEGLKEELEKDYSLVVLDYNWNNCFDKLEKVPYKERCELLINPCCVPNCKRRKQHYEHIGRYQMAIAEYVKRGSRKPFQFEEFSCDCITPHFYDTIKHRTHIKPQDIYEKYVPMGFENFKIEGRATHQSSVIESYVYYMVKPEYRDEIRLTMHVSEVKLVKK